MRIWCLVVVLVVGCRGVSTPTIAPAPYDPPKPTLRLPRHFAPVAYTATLGIDPAQPGFTGHLEVAGTLDRAAAVIWLNARELTVTRATANGKAVQVTAHDELLEVRGAFAAGPVTLVFDYEGKIAPTGVRGVFRKEDAGRPYIYTYFEPIHARTAFPCIDEPDRKTPWTLAIETPADQIAVSNTTATTTKLPDGRTRTRFATTKPLPSYLVAFGVGPFDIVAGGTSKAGVPLRFIVPKGEGRRTAYAALQLPRIVDMLTAYFDVPFPYDKLDILVVPTMAGGAMEHVGLITSDASNVLADADASWRTKQNIVLTLGHETSHQWFGDLVTPAWFDDTWLKEGFATWMEDKVMNALEPTWHRALHAVDVRNDAFGADTQRGARVVRQKLERPEQIQGTFDAMSYTKGAAIINVFERHVGAEALRRALRDYFRAHAHGVAAYADFIASIERSTGKHLAAGFSSFLDRPGVPRLDMTLACEGRTAAVTVRQQRLVLGGTAPDAPPWNIPLCIVHEQNGKRAETCGTLDAARGEIALPSCPAWWWPNAGGLGYYYASVSKADVETLRDRAWDFLAPGERRALFEDVRMQVLRGALPASVLMSLVPKLVAMGDRFSIADVLGQGNGLPTGLDAGLEPDLRAPLAAWVQAQFGPLARQRGFEPRPDEGIDDESTRRALIRTVGRGDPALVKQAIARAARYRDLPESTRRLVLPIAINADPKLVDRLRTDVLGEIDRDMRASILDALVALEDPARMPALDVLLDAKLPAEDVAFALGSRGRTPAAVQLTSTWLRANIRAMLARFPADEGSFASYLAFGVFTCDPAERDAALAFLRDTFRDVPHAEKAVQQQSERIAQCIASRATLAPSLREWLRPGR